MAKCTVCGKWGLFMKLQSGLCPSCTAKAQSKIEPINSMPVVTTVLASETPSHQVSVNMQSSTVPPIEQEKQNVPKKAAPKTYRVTGMQHYMDNLMSLAIDNIDYNSSKRVLIDEGLIDERIWEKEFFPVKTEVIPEPNNPVDPKAIKVVVDGKHVGYIKSGSCAHLLKVIREGRIKKIDCEIAGGPYKRINEDYDEEKDKDVYTLEHGNSPYFVHLLITEE